MARNTAARGKSGSHRFASTPTISTPRSSFNHSHGHTTTFDGGWLIPIQCTELLPGDTMKMRVRSFIRMLTALYPVMDQGWIDTFSFFVPNRLVWDNFKKFMGEETNPGDFVDYLVPTVAFTGPVTESSIFDYFGLPVNVDLSTTPINALPFRGYGLIYNEWFRPQDLTGSHVVFTTNGPDPETEFRLLKRSKRHDYFTSCQPFAQKGPEPQISLGGQAPLVDANILSAGTGIPGQPVWRGTGAVGGTPTGQLSTQVDEYVKWEGDALLEHRLEWEDPALIVDPTAYADLGTATAITINQLRESITLQQFYERQSRAGTRYTEQVESMFGVKSPDSRQQRPEYLAGSSHPLNVHPVAQTAPGTSGVTSDLSSFVTGGGTGNNFTYSATEHGYVITLACARANLTYQQGIHRMWSRRTRFDFAFPQFAHLGEQEVYNREIYADGTAADEEIFGYNSRYSEYRFAENRLSGLFRSTATASLDAWHLAQEFDSRPALNTAFIEENPPFKRTTAVQNEDTFKGDFFFDITMVRPLPLNGTPGLRRF